MTDNPTPASLRSLGSEDDEPRVAAGATSPVHRWLDHITVTAGNRVTITTEGTEQLDPDTRARICDPTNPATRDATGWHLGLLAQRRTNPAAWGYSSTWQDPAVDGSRTYRTASAAAQACAIQIIVGPQARQHFDAAQPLPVPARRPKTP
jgi:hypothetical protein